MDTFFKIMAATAFVSALSLVGILFLSLKERLLQKATLLLVALSAGTLIGGAFLHLLPESLERSGSEKAFSFLLAGFVLFLAMEKLFSWRHCHKANCPQHSFGYANLIGDGLHNFIDGLVIAASFSAGTSIGIAATIAIVLHELPQEIGDFGVLLYSGFKKSKALALNFASAAIALLGGAVGFFLSERIEGSVQFLLPLAAGGFIYIAAADLVPEIRKEKRPGKFLGTFAIFLLGIALMKILCIME